MNWLVLDTVISVVLVSRLWPAWRALERWPRVPVDDRLAADAAAPSVAVVVPARNEAQRIGRCLRSLLALRYPHDRLRFVIVDDESCDSTADVVAAVAGTDPRVRLLSGAPPPRGWLGKAWALHQAVQQVAPSTEYLLFTDADTVHDPLVLASALAYLQRARLDLLSLGTGQELVGTAERLLLPWLYGLAMTVAGTFDEVNDRGRIDCAKANGQFILVSAAAYARVGGHAAVRDAVVEDFEFARRAKRLGVRLQLADGRHLVRTRGYTSLGEIWAGFSKNALVETSRLPGGVAAALAGLPIVTLGPYLALAVAARRRSRPGDLALAAQATLQIGLLLGSTSRAASAFGLPVGYGLSQPGAALFLWLLLITSALRRLRGEPDTWKGRAIRGLRDQDSNLEPTG